MHRTLLEEKHWVGENRFLHALNYCMLIGWVLHRTKVGLFAGTIFILPGSLSILALLSKVPLVEGLDFGLKAAVLHAIQRIGKRALKNNVLPSIAAASDPVFRDQSINGALMRIRYRVVPN
jgi:chromate transporter